jgi:hypothetical protein
MRTPFPVKRDELLTACHHTLSGYDPKKPNKPLKPVAPELLCNEAHHVALQMRDKWLWELGEALVDYFPCARLVKRFPWIVKKVADVDESCAVTLEDDLDDEAAAVAERAAYGLAVLHWYRLLNSDQVDDLVGFTVEECALWLRNYKGPEPPEPEPESLQLALF